jgi:hypothetical protein
VITLLWYVLCCLQGQVYAMAVAAPALFTAGQDCSIRVWNFNEQAGIFMSAVSVRMLITCPLCITVYCSQVLCC